MNVKWSVFFCACLFLISPSLSEAHQIKTDGSMSVLLHTDPNDDPYAGMPAMLHFVFTDSEKQFKMEDCECHAYISPYNQREAIEKKGFVADLNAPNITRVYGSYTFEYVFPQRDVYAVLVKGAPKNGAAFKPFSMLYDLRIAKGENLPVALAGSLHGSLFTMAMLTTLAIIFFIVVGILIRRLVFKK
jgi:hypothetical protein